MVAALTCRSRDERLAALRPVKPAVRCAGKASGGSDVRGADQADRCAHGMFGRAARRPLSIPSLQCSSISRKRSFEHAWIEQTRTGQARGSLTSRMRTELTSNGQQLRSGTKTVVFVPPRKALRLQKVSRDRTPRQSLRGSGSFVAGRGSRRSPHPDELVERPPSTPSPHKARMTASANVPEVIWLLYLSHREGLEQPRPRNLVPLLPGQFRIDKVARAA